MSDTIFEGQAWRLKLNTGISLVGATTVHIDYVDPAGETGELTGTVDAQYIYYDFPTGVITAGDWKFQTHAIIAGLDYVGELYEKNVEPRLVPLI